MQTRDERQGAAVISTRGLSKHFGPLKAVDNLDLSVQEGDVFGFLGPNGAGKTTTIRMLLGLIAPTTGTVALFGQDLHAHRDKLLRRVGAIVEAPVFYPYLSGRDNLRAVGLASGGYTETRLDEVLKLVDLDERDRDKFKTYSLGMKQRLAIAATLLNDPALIMLDEPSNGLDPAGVVEIRQLINRLAGLGKTIFITSHNLFEVQQVASRVAIVKQGRLITETTVSALLADTGRQAGEIWLRVPDLEAAGRLLAALPFVSGISHNVEGYLVANAAFDTAAAINEQLARAGIFASEITPHRPSLESVFLELTGQEGTVEATTATNMVRRS